MIEHSSFLTRRMDDEDTAEFWKGLNVLSPTQSTAGSHTSAVRGGGICVV